MINQFCFESLGNMANVPIPITQREYKQKHCVKYSILFQNNPFISAFKTTQHCFRIYYSFRSLTDYNDFVTIDD